MYFYYHRVIPVVKYSYGVVLGWYDVCFVWNEAKSVVFRVLARKFLKVRKKKQKKTKTQNPKPPLRISHELIFTAIILINIFIIMSIMCVL